VKKSQLSDKQLEEILGQMPKIKDHRDPRDIYQNIAHKVEKRKMPTWVIPSAALAAVLFLAFILSPGLMDWNQSADKSIDSKSSPESNMAMDMDAGQKDEVKESSDQAEDKVKMDIRTDKDNKENEFMAKMVDNPYAGLNSLYEEELANQENEVLTYAIPDQNAQVLIPVTTVVPKEEGKPWIDSFTETMPKLKEEKWGLSEFYPVDASFSYDENTKSLNMDVKADHPYQHGSVSSTMLLDAMSQNLAGQGVEKMTFTTDQKPGVDFGNYGILKEAPISTTSKEMRAYMFYKQDYSTQPLLVPTQEQFDSFILALEKMRGNIEELNLTASLPNEFQTATIEENEDGIKIILDNSNSLNNEFLPNLEAILMTAKEFGYASVKLENAGTDQLGPFNLADPIPVPVAPNKKIVE
jgi:hypothetical protein